MDPWKIGQSASGGRYPVTDRGTGALGHVITGLLAPSPERKAFLRVAGPAFLAIAGTFAGLHFSPLLGLAGFCAPLGAIWIRAALGGEP